MRAILVWVSIAVASAVHAQTVDWPAIGSDPGGSQYSPVDQITPANVAELELAWVHRSGDVAGRDSETGATALEAIPIHVNGTLYYCTPLNRVFALDPATGREKWVFDAQTLIDKPRRAGICRGAAGRVQCRR
jgi:quinoprotein glucose dehydrogenase